MLPDFEADLTQYPDLPSQEANPSVEGGWQQPQTILTWYGLPARILPSRDGLCDVALLGVSLPHPSLINLTTRLGLPERLKARFFLLHEFGHLQTLPLVGLPLLLLHRHPVARRKTILLKLLALQAFWELFSEGYVVLKTGRAYLAAWRASRNPAILIFWPMMLLLATLPFRSRSSGFGRRERD